MHPAVLLTRLSREVYAENAGGSYLTCIIARLDSASRTHRSRGPYGIADWQDDRTVLAFQFDGAI